MSDNAIYIRTVHAAQTGFAFHSFRQKLRYIYVPTKLKQYIIHPKNAIVGYSRRVHYMRT